MKRVASSKAPQFQASQIRTELAERKLSHFARQAWAITESGRPYLHNWHIDAISEHLEAVLNGQIRFLLINVPFRSMKSILGAVDYVPWAWIHKPQIRFLYSSYALQLSLRDGRRSMQLMQSDWYRERWGDKFTVKGVASKVENTSGGYRLATSTDSSVTGEGGDIIFVDDPNNVRDVESDAIRGSTNDWMDRTVSTRMNDPQTSAIVVVQQRSHQSDVSGHLLAQGGYTHLCIPGEFEAKRRCVVPVTGWQDPRTEEGESYWHGRVDRPELDKYKTMLGSYSYAGQVQQRPAPAEGGLCKRAWWRRYREKPDRFDQIIHSWDLKFKKMSVSSWVVGQVWGKLGVDVYLLEQARAQLGFSETCFAIQSMRDRWRDTNGVLVEDKANGPAVMEVLSKKIPGLIAVDPGGGKEARASAVLPLIEAGNVYVPDGLSWADDFIEEWAYIPNGTFWDQVDASSQALLYMYRNAPIDMSQAYFAGQLASAQEYSSVAL